MKVTKRDGREVFFQKGKIISAVHKAFAAVDGRIGAEAIDTAASIADYIESLARDLTVEEIQDIVEEKLMATSRKDVARAYVIYRSDRSRTRARNSDMMRRFGDKLAAKNIDRQNANVDEQSFGGRVGAATSEIMKEYALNHCMSEQSRRNHLNNEIYIHDLDNYAIGNHNCLSIPFDDLLAKGFNTRQTDVRPAQSVNTAFQLVAVIFQLQSLQQFGGCSATHIDWTMVPYVRKSFMKHYIAAWLKDQSDIEDLDLMDMLFDTYEEDAGTVRVVRNRLDDWIDYYKERFFDKTGRREEDFRLDNKADMTPKYYQSALYDTIVETKQAIEGMYHNLKKFGRPVSNAGNTVV